MKYVFFPQTPELSKLWHLSRHWNRSNLGWYIPWRSCHAETGCWCPTITSWEDIWAPNIDCACGWVPTLGASGAWYLLESPEERWRTKFWKLYSSTALHQNAVASIDLALVIRLVLLWFFKSQNCRDHDGIVKTVEGRGLIAFTEDLSIVTRSLETASFYKSLRTMPWEQPQSLQGDSPPKAITAGVESCELCFI